MIVLKIANVDWHFERLPDECPLCHHAIDPRYLVGVVRSYAEYGKSAVEMVFQCPRKDCLRVFIGIYHGMRDPSIADHLMHLAGRTPFTPVPPSHPEDVATLSPSFVAIFGQAAAAEGWQLSEIAGCGYRKALEFLIKDYCILEHPTEAEAIKKTLLGQVISNYVADANIKECAKRAAWLGNDETHYERRWADKDIKDLKTLIALTVSWVNTHLLTKKYLSSMNG